jgi:hypothetical protein
MLPVRRSAVCCALALAAGAAACYGGDLSGTSGSVQGNLNFGFFGGGATKDFNFAVSGVNFGDQCGLGLGVCLNRGFKLTLPTSVALGGRLTISTCTSYTNFDTTRSRWACPTTATPTRAPARSTSSAPTTTGAPMAAQ